MQWGGQVGVIRGHSSSTVDTLPDILETYYENIWLGGEDHVEAIEGISYPEYFLRPNPINPDEHQMMIGMSLDRYAIAAQAYVRGDVSLH